MKKSFTFTPKAQEIYKEVRITAINRQIKIKHPDQPMMDRKHWETICHNFAVIAASAYEGKEIILGGKPLKAD